MGGALEGILEQDIYGITVLDSEHRYVYVNRGGRRLMGTARERYLGRHVLESFPAREHDAVLRRLASTRTRARGPWHGTLLGPHGQENTISWILVPLSLAGSHSLIFRDTSATVRAARNAAALGQAAAAVAAPTELPDVFGQICQHVVSGTQAVGCEIAASLTGESLDTAAGYGDLRLLRPLAERGVRIGDLPAADALTAAQVVYLPQPRPRDCPLAAPPGALRGLHDRDTLTCIPLIWRDTLLGVLVAAFTDVDPGPCEEELAFCAALADQAATAAANQRLLRERDRALVEKERCRISRELHDSVTQDLFAMTLHASAAERALSRCTEEPSRAAHTSVRRLRSLCRLALGEMRMLLLELRPEELARNGLTASLAEQAAIAAAHTGIDITVSGTAEGVEVGAEAEAHLYRIVREAMNNAIRHAQPRSVRVHLAEQDSELVVTVADDGRGLPSDPTGRGRRGLRIMRERAALFGGQCHVRREPRGGTLVMVRCPLKPGLDVSA